ncbi:Agd3-related carbohydrate-binding protein [Deinococcus marmoris]|uniref:Agd3 CBM87 domain-containing protein n=1 Tax=Deinococcus marmoris TaxID=249408 RepID=A0A1U7NY95_9DEIO|nr:hypothetical protein [Deinococcus marmoris]OLV17880.1 hypothetical protein BOO71_0007510 [Deinococcus marmoris]
MTKLNNLFPSALLLSAALILTGCGGGSAPGPSGSAPDGKPDTGIVGENGVKLSDIARYGETVSASEGGNLTPTGAVAGDIRRLLPQGFGAQRLGPATVPAAPAGRLSAQAIRAQALPGNAQTGKVALKILVLHAGAANFGLAPAKALLSQHGVAYDTLDATAKDLNLSTLIGPDGVGKYSGVILASNSLTTENSPGVFTSALNDAEWATLFEYEAAYKVRQLALFGFPGIAPEDYGVRAVPGAETGTSDATVTAGGKAVFSDLTANTVPVRFSYAYPSRLEAVPNVTTTPLLTDANGNLLAVSSTAADGRERLLLTMAQNEYLTHTQLLGYGMVQWLTKGVYLGEYRRYLGVDIDDWFATGDRYDAPTKTVLPNAFRLKASDALSVRDQQAAVRKDYSVARNFTYAMMYNGLGADILAPKTCSPSTGVKDPLSAVTKCLSQDFDWVNHTRDHLLMDDLSLNESFNQIFQNTLIGLFMGLKLSYKTVLTGEISGLGWKSLVEGQPKVDYGLGASNINFLNAATLSGVQYVPSNRSVASHWDASCPTCGIFHPLKPNILLVPRWPNNVFYYSSTPDEAATSYNAVYGPGGVRPYWPSALNYTEYLDKESDIGLQHVLSGAAWPHYMHQPNLNQYAPGKSVATDWVRAVLDKYSKASTLPVNTLAWDDLGAYVDRHTREEKAKAAGQLGAVWDRKTNTVAVTSRAGTLPVSLTGATSGSVYGAARILNRTVSGTVNVAVTPR